MREVSNRKTWPPHSIACHYLGILLDHYWETEDSLKVFSGEFFFFDTQNNNGRNFIRYFHDYYRSYNRGAERIREAIPDEDSCGVFDLWKSNKVRSFGDSSSRGIEVDKTYPR